MDEQDTINRYFPLMKPGDLMLLKTPRRFYRNEDELLLEPDFRPVVNHSTDLICVVLEESRFIDVCTRRKMIRARENPQAFIQDYTGMVKSRWIVEEEEITQSVYDREPFVLVMAMGEKVLVSSWDLYPM